MSVEMQPIAIVGVAAQLPSGSYADTDLDYRSFFDFLLNKGEAYESVPSSRFNIGSIRGRAVGQVLTDTGAFLKDLDLFDHMEFGITAKDARFMPVGLRKLIEVSFLSLCDSGIEYRGKNVGCYMSAVAHDMISVSGHDDTEIAGSFANVPSMIANRISFHLDLRGPSVPIDTACSSSLYATHLAVQALRNGECEAAVVGGAQINHRFAEWLSYTHGGIMSPDGKCKPFDISANGFGRGEGVVSIVLKPLDAALRDSDHVYGTILGTGVNSSGSLVPANAPAAPAQREAMLRAFREAQRVPQDVDFIELHATGTAQGDPTEANWVGAEFKRNDELVIGSVKGNIGHLEITAFLASLCKVCGIFETGQIPPNVNLVRPNPAIRWSQFRLRVPREPEQLRCRSADGLPLIAMTSSGIGGANGHAVVQGPPPRSSRAPFWTDEVDIPTLVVAGALSPRSAAALGEALLNAAVSTGEKSALARILGRRARSMTWRSFAILGSPKSSNLSKPALAPKARPPIVFVFSGQGTQHFHMGRELFKASAPFRASITELDAIYASVVGTSLIESTGIFSGAAADAKDTLGDPWPIAVTLPALTMLQLALIDTLAAVGVRPDIVVGHSAGETAVLYASGAASKAAALELAIARGRALALVEEAKGTMAAVSCSPKDAQKFIDEVNAELGKGVLSIGCYNTPNAVTLSGVESHIDLAVAKATAAGVFARKLKTRVPVHSEMMELCRAEFQQLTAELFARHEVSTPKVATYSTVTGELFTRAPDPQYYWDGTLGPVRFTDAIQGMVRKHKTCTFVEVGPHPVLISYLQSMTEGRDSVTITCPLRRPRAPEPGMEVFEFLTALGKVVAAGHNCVDFDTLYANAGRFTGTLPKYPFAPKVVPWRAPTADIARQRQHRNGPMNYLQLEMNVRTHPGLADHVIKGEPIMPAAGFMEMALEYGASAVYNVQFHGLLSLSHERPLPVQVKLDGTKWSVSSASSTDYTKSWPVNYNRLHATGFLSLDPIQDRGIAPLDVNAIRQRTKPVDMNLFYPEVESFAQFGRMYRRIRQCHIGTGQKGAVEALTEIRAWDTDIPNVSDYVLHPAILDAAIHVVISPRITGNHDPNLYHLPSKITALRLCPAFKQRPLPSTIFAHATFVDWTPETITYNFTVADPQGTPLFVIEGAEITLHGHRLKHVEKRFDVVYKPIDLSLAAYAPSAEETGVVHSNGHAANGNGHPSDRSHVGALVIPYVRGEEMKVQKALVGHDPLEPLSVLVVADDGLNGDASLGFTRSLRKEFSAWTIRVVVFDASWTPAQKEKATQHLLHTPTDDLDLYIAADGSVTVPRVELAEPPAEDAPFDSQKPWKVEQGKVAQISAPHPVDDHVVVRVQGVVARHGPHWIYVGAVEGGAQQILGITSQPIATHLLAHLGTFVELAIATSADPASPDAALLALTLVAHAVGPLDPRRLRGSRALIIEGDEQLRIHLSDVCRKLGLDVLGGASLSTEDLEASYAKAPSFVFSGIRDPKDIAVLRSIAGRRGHLSLWNVSDEDLSPFTTRNPWALGDALRHAVAFLNVSNIKYIPLSDLLGEIPSVVAHASELFDAEKAYLLVGGVGSLGLQISLWMYQNGARHIILTSRSGASTLARHGDYIAERILAYLQSRPDVTVEALAVDATSPADMAALVSGLKRPLSGCMLLTALLSDSTFASHTEESFERAFPPKLTAFAVLESVVSIPSLDFFIAFSSVTGLFGNPGQTNYTSANTALAGMTKKYSNAYSLIAPLITDSSFLLMNDDSHYTTRLRHVKRWGMTGQELCDYIGDGLRLLRSGRQVWQYVPDFNWLSIRENIGFSTVYDHLVPKVADEAAESEEARPATVIQIVCHVLDLKESEVSVDVPLTTYGLDSLSAVALSYALRPLLAITQLQLLADLAIKDIQARVDAGAAK